MSMVKPSIRANYLVIVWKEGDSHVFVTVPSVGAFMAQTYLLFGCYAISPEFTFAFTFYFGSTIVFLSVFLDIFQRLLIISTHLYVFFFSGVVTSHAKGLFTLYSILVATSCRQFWFFQIVLKLSLLILLSASAYDQVSTDCDGL